MSFSAIQALIIRKDANNSLTEVNVMTDGKEPEVGRQRVDRCSQVQLQVDVGTLDDEGEAIDRDTHAHKGRRGLLVVELIDVMVVDVAAPCGGGEEALR